MWHPPSLLQPGRLSENPLGDAIYAGADLHIPCLLLYPYHIRRTGLTPPGGPRVFKGLNQCTGCRVVCSAFQMLPLQEGYQGVGEGPLSE